MLVNFLLFFSFVFLLGAACAVEGLVNVANRYPVFRRLIWDVKFAVVSRALALSHWLRTKVTAQVDGFAYRVIAGMRR